MPNADEHKPHKHIEKETVLNSLKTTCLFEYITLLLLCSIRRKYVKHLLKGKESSEVHAMNWQVICRKI